MQINRTDINTFGAKLIGRNISNNRMSSNYTWEYSFDRPTFYGSSLDFKDVQLTMLFQANNEETFLKNYGKISEMFRKGADVKFKDISYTYKMYLKQKAEYEKLNTKWYKVEFTLDGDFGLSSLKEFEVTENTQLVVKNNGTYATPARIEITFTGTHNNFTITGFEHSIKLKDVASGKVFAIDGATGDIEYDGRNGIDKFVGWYLPKLPVGTTTIVSSEPCTMRVTFQERY